MFNDLQGKIEGFYELSKNQSSSLLKELNSRINREPEQFKKFMIEIGYGFETNRPIFYEALIESNQNKWGDYILEELKLLIQKAESGDENAIYELSSVHWLTDIPDMEREFYEKTKSFLFAKLKSSVAEIRELTLTAIFDILNHLRDQPNDIEAAQLVDCLNDSHFRNKVYAYSELQEANLIPKDFRFTTLEKVKIKVKGYSNLA